MTRYAITVIDGSRARFYQLDSEDPVLIELRDLVNPEHRMSGAEKFSETKTGMVYRANGQPRSVDDHRDAHDMENERRFAKRIAAEQSKLAEEHSLRRMLLVTTHRMMGFLTEPMLPLSKLGYQVEFMTKDLSNLSASDLHTQLAAEGKLPPPIRPGLVNAHNRSGGRAG